MSMKNRLTLRNLLTLQALFLGAFAVSWLLLPQDQQQRIKAEIQSRRPLADVVLSNREPAIVQPLYDDAHVVSDEHLAGVLQKILPRFGSKKLRPNFVEHALRVWGSQIEFQNPELISGPQMVEYLLNSGQYLTSWGDDADPILEPNEDGIHIRWGVDSSTSVHHDHMLACLAEAGVSLDRPVFTTSRRLTMQQVLSEALRDFRLDERETEWSVMAFGLYLFPQQTTSWHNSQGRKITLDMLADRLIRTHRRKGVCLGTHRIYSLMAMLRLDDQYGPGLLAKETRERIMDFLRGARDLIIAAQDKDGSWPPNWHDGADAGRLADPDEPIYRRVISTGHHLEWLAIAPQELHPPRESIVRAAEWVIRNTLETPQDVVDSNYTYYSHVGNALALWRKTSVSDFWQQWRSQYPDAEVLPEKVLPEKAVGDEKAAAHGL